MADTLWPSVNVVAGSSVLLGAKIAICFQEKSHSGTEVQSPQALYASTCIWPEVGMIEPDLV